VTVAEIGMVNAMESTERMTLRDACNAAEELCYEDVFGIDQIGVFKTVHLLAHDDVALEIRQRVARKIG
jgi:hypothetical protein